MERATILTPLAPVYATISPRIVLSDRPDLDQIVPDQSIV